MVFLWRKSRESFLCVLVILMATFLVVGCASEEIIEPEAADEEEKIVYPEKPISIVVPYGVGGSGDISARLLQPYLEKELGIPIIVENEPGAGSRIGTQRVYTAEPDGYTLLLTHFPTMAIGDVAFGGKYNTLDFEYIYAWEHDSMGVFVRAEAPWPTLGELIEASQKEDLLVASSYHGQTAHLQYLTLREIGFQAEYIPYASGGETLAALLGGHADVGLANFSNASDHVKSGNLRVLAVHSAERSEILPDIPTVLEEGYEGAELNFYRGLTAPPGTPLAVITILEKALEKVVSDADFQQRSFEFGFKIIQYDAKMFRQAAEKQVELAEHFKEELAAEAN